MNTILLQVKLGVLFLFVNIHILNAAVFDWHAAASTDPDSVVAHYIDGPINIKGFAYLQSTDVWWLAPQPHLRSCCLSKYACVMLAQPTLDLDEHVVVHLQGNLKAQSTPSGAKYLLLDNVQKAPYEPVENSMQMVGWLTLLVAIGLTGYATYSYFKNTSPHHDS